MDFEITHRILDQHRTQVIKSLITGLILWIGITLFIAVMIIFSVSLKGSIVIKHSKPPTLRRLTQFIEIPPINDTENITISSKGNITKKEIASWSWRDCNVSMKYHNRTEALYHQLIDIVAVLNEHKVPHLIAYGTLIGVLRDHSMNPFEVDNDIVLLDPSFNKIFSHKIYQDFYDRGLIIFKDDIWKICRRREHGQRLTDEAPWGSKYFPYTDLYPISWVKREDPGFKAFWKSGGQIIRRKLRNITVFTPNDRVSNHWLSYWYGNWLKVPGSDMKYGQQLE